jgi:hypothetical protein
VPPRGLELTLPLSEDPMMPVHDALATIAPASSPSVTRDERDFRILASLRAQLRKGQATRTSLRRYCRQRNQQEAPFADIVARRIFVEKIATIADFTHAAFCKYGNHARQAPVM